MYEKASAIPDDASNYQKDLKLASFERIIKLFNERFEHPGSRLD
jgi:hypothetical protein